MQMYLFHQPGTSSAQDPFIASNGGDEADVVYHEYTHGLSNRLVVDANGNSTLGNVQAGSMGEAWSDWYAMDYLVNQGQLVDTKASGDLRVGDYVGAGKDLIRTQPLDCPVGSTSAKCPGLPGKPGGYTYGDFGAITGGPEVHADGEIWGETLWDLRTRTRLAGGRVARDPRHGALAGQPVVPGHAQLDPAGRRRSRVASGYGAIWSVFANRGMGYFAGPPTGTTRRRSRTSRCRRRRTRRAAHGTVTDLDTGAPVRGAIVAFGGHDSGFAGDLTPLIPEPRHVRRHASSRVRTRRCSRGARYDPRGADAAIASRDEELALRRDWAASAGGATIDVHPPDYTAFGCGPKPDRPVAGRLGQRLDRLRWLSHHAGGRSSSCRSRSPSPNSRSIPPTRAGDDATASTKDYRVETSADGSTWTVAKEAAFGDADRGRLNLVAPTAGATNVHYVRFTMLSQQLAASCATSPNQSGCAFADMSELEVYGRPGSASPAERGAAFGRPLAFS